MGIYRILEISSHFHHDVMLLHGIHNPLLQFSIIKDEQDWNAHNVVSPGCLRIGIHIDLSHPDFSFGCHGEFIDYGCYRTAGGTPRRPEKNQHRDGRLQHFCIKVRVGKGDRLGEKQLICLEG